MKSNNSSVVAICSALNALFLIGLVSGDKFWNSMPSWAFYLFILLMTINAGALIAYAFKGTKK